LVLAQVDQLLLRLWPQARASHDLLVAACRLVSSDPLPVWEVLDLASVDRQGMGHHHRSQEGHQEDHQDLVDVEDHQAECLPDLVAHRQALVDLLPTVARHLPSPVVEDHPVSADAKWRGFGRKWMKY
jgi:hypothetical protein